MKKQDVVGKAVAAIIVGGVLFVGWRSFKEGVKSAVEGTVNDLLKRPQELLAQKNYDGVIAYCTEAIPKYAKTGPEATWSLYYTRAVAYFCKKEFGSALADLNEVVRIKADGDSLQLRAKVHEELGNFPLAAADTVRSHALKTAKGSGATSEVELTPELVKAEKTLEYWYRITHSRGKNPPHAPTERKELASMFRQCATSIEALPTANVDLDAVRCGLRFKAWMHRTADFIETNNDAANFGEAFLRGLAGDSFGKAIEGFQDVQAWERELKEIAQSLSDTRALLSARYGIEFPF